MTATAREAFEEAVALESSGDLDKALVAYLKAQELAPQDTEIAYRAASALLQAGYLEEAQSQLRRVVFAEPDNLNAKASLGNCHLLLGDVENAKQNFSEVLQLNPDNLNALYGLASVFLKQDKADEAAKPAKRLLELLPETPEVLTLFAETQAKSSQNAASIAAYRKAIKVNPEFTPALLGLAEILLRRKRLDEVIALTISANQLAPADPLSLELLADALSGKGALDDALEAAEAALKLNERSTTALVRLSVLSRKSGNHLAALDYALKGHTIDEKAAEPLNALGAALAALKYANQARTVLTSLSSGKGLAPDIRELAEELVASLASAENEEKAASGVVSEGDISNQTTDPRIENDPEGEPERASQLAQLPEDTIIEERPKQSARPHAPLSDDDTLPNVLGLQRRDRS